MNKKRKKAMLGLIIGIFFIGISIPIVCVIKYKVEHRYLKYEELPQDAIVFLVEMSAWDTYVEECKYDAGGKRYYTTYTREDFYDDITRDIISQEIEEDYIIDDEVKYMYELLLQVDTNAEYETLSNIVTLDMSRSCFVGILYRADGEVEYVYLARGQGERLLERMEEPDAKEICDWLLEL